MIDARSKGSMTTQERKNHWHGGCIDFDRPQCRLHLLVTVHFMAGPLTGARRPTHRHSQSPALPTTNAGTRNSNFNLPVLMAQGSGGPSKTCQSIEGGISEPVRCISCHSVHVHAEGCGLRAPDVDEWSVMMEERCRADNVRLSAQCLAPHLILVAVIRALEWK